MRNFINLVEFQQQDVEKMINTNGSGPPYGNGGNGGRGKGPWDDEPDDGEPDEPHDPTYNNGFDFTDVDAFTNAYIEAMLWTEEERIEEQGWNCYFSSIEVNSLRSIISDCALFQTEAADLLKNIDDAQAGHDFWLTRAGHGTGFWDRGLGKLGDKLTKLAKKWREVNIEARPQDGAIVI
jgi:hypothetical protein